MVTSRTVSVLWIMLVALVAGCVDPALPGVPDVAAQAVDDATPDEIAVSCQNVWGDLFQPPGTVGRWLPEGFEPRTLAGLELYNVNGWSCDAPSGRFGVVWAYVTVLPPAEWEWPGALHHVVLQVRTMDPSFAAALQGFGAGDVGATSVVVTAQRVAGALATGHVAVEALGTRFQLDVEGIVPVTSITTGDTRYFFVRDDNGTVAVAGAADLTLTGTGAPLSRGPSALLVLEGAADHPCSACGSLGTVVPEPRTLTLRAVTPP